MKKAVSLITAAVMTMAAAGSFASFAEDEYSYKSSPIYDEIYEITLKNTDEYMTKLKSSYARFDDELNDKYLDIFLSREQLCVSENDLPLKVYFPQPNKNNRPYLWPVEIDPYAVKMKFKYPEGKTYKNTNEYLKKIYKDYNLNVNGSIMHLKSYSTTDEEAELIDKIDIKAVVQDLYDNNLIESAELSYGTTYAPPMDQQYISAVAGIYATDKINVLPEDERITNQDILEWREKGTIDCNFGMLIVKSDIPQGVEYLDYGEMDTLDYDHIFYPDAFGLVPITPENAANVDEELLEKMKCFAAVPYENTFENHIDLMYRISQEIPILYGQICGTDLAGSLNIYGVTIDLLNAVDGDANCDNLLSMADAASIYQSLGNPDKYSLSIAGRFNAECEGGNDGITASDALHIQKKLAKIIE